ncbi:hypothetical protein HYV84_08075 [Candidatus Woesearchaeota archaeon]|nr:hypothetical protein [Candidatus Woesearchaeota archaeon]
MMEPKDWISGGVGGVVFLLGIMPLLGKIGIGPAWFNFSLPLSLFSWVVAIGGFYLVVNSVIEITNSNSVGWVSFAVAAAITAVGVLNVLGKFGIVSGFFAFSFISATVFNVLFVILGIFLIIATFAMEL